MVLGPGIPLEVIKARAVLPPAGQCTSCRFPAMLAELHTASTPYRCHLPPLPRLSGFAL